MRRSAGPWRSVMVPTTTSMSACRGEKRGNSEPNRAMSYLGPAVAMNSIPQQAVTKGYWNSENLRAQLVAAASLVVWKGSNPMATSSLLPAYRTFPPDVGQRDDEDGHEDHDAAQAEERHPGRAYPVLQRTLARQRPVVDRPRVEE